MHLHSKTNSTKEDMKLEEDGLRWEDGPRRSLEGRGGGYGQNALYVCVHCTDNY